MLDVRPLTATIGAELAGVDLARAGDDEAAAVRAALLAHKVVFVRDPGPLTPRAQAAFAARLGPVRPFPFGQPPDPDVPEVMELATGGPGPRTANADIWHADATFLPSPPIATMLRAVRLPAVGGDTLWADTEAAYDALSSRVQRLIDDMTATHDVAKSSSHRGPGRSGFEPVSHPVVRVHPETGRKSLFVNRIFTVRLDGVTERENEALLPLLCDHVRSPEFQCRFTWTPGAVAIWDNRCTQHYAVADYDEPRLMHRCVIDG